MALFRRVRFAQRRRAGFELQARQARVRVKAKAAPNIVGQLATSIRVIAP